MNGRRSSRSVLVNQFFWLLAGVVMVTAGRKSGNNRNRGDDPASSILMNNLLELDESLPECSAAFRRVQDGERTAHATYPPDIKGLWVSQECETRPGPEFVLRQYQFERDGSFKLLQHFYSDEWCTTPVYTLTARGQLQTREPSWIVPGAAECEYTLHRVHLVAYSEDVVDEVMQRVNRSCPGYINRPWRVRKEYVIYSYGAGEGHEVQQPARSGPSDRHWMTASNGKRHGNGSGRGNKAGSDQRSKRVSHNGSHHHHPVAVSETAANGNDNTASLDEIDCLSAFHAVYHELQLMRTVRRPRDLLAETPAVNQQSHQKTSNNNKKKSHHHPSADEQTLLFLGNIHPQLELRAYYRPTAYQPALVRYNHHEANDCHVCHLVAKSNDKSPPHLHARPRLPVYPMGEWVSSSCETRSIGTFLMRRMKFIDHQNGLNGKYVGAGAPPPTFQALFHYFADPICSNATLTVLASGHYSPGTDSDRVQGATEFDFFVQSVVITVHDEFTARNLNGLKGNQCAMDGSWRVDRPQDVTLTGGCIGLGIRVPTVANDLLKMDVNGIGHPLLYFGIAENPSEPRTPTKMSSLDGKSAPLDPLRPTSYLPPLQQCQSSWEDLNSVNDASNELGPIIPHARVSGEAGSSASSQATVTFACWTALTLANAIYRLRF